EPKDAKAALSNVGVVQDHHGVGGEFWLPRKEIMADGLVGMQAVDVQKVDRRLLEMWQRVVEGRANEAGKSPIARSMESREIAIDLLGVKAGVLIAFPGIDGEAASWQAQHLHRLAHGGIGHARVSSEFDNCRWPQNIDKPEGEGHVLGPRRWRLAL